MLIDWFTVVAQVLNFLVLVWLLKRFAYRPILDAINAREQRIAAQVAAATAAQAAASAERETLGRRTEELERHRAALLDQVTQEAQATRSRLLEQARQDADAQRARLVRELDAEQADLRRALRAKVCTEVLQIAGGALRDLARVDLNEAMTDVFLEHLQGLSDADWSLLVSAGVGPGVVVVRSAFELTPGHRDRIQAATAALRGPGSAVVFETVTDLICGIELRAGGYKLAWSVGDHLAALESGIEGMLAEYGGSGRAAATPAAIA